MNDIIENQNAEQGDDSDSRFSMIVFGLGGIIILLLVGLWIMERGHRNRAEARVRDITKAVTEQQRKMQAFGQLVATQAVGGKIIRSELPTTEIQCNGKKQTALMLSASAGEKIGLLPGDIVLVTPRPKPAETQPAKK